jgi:hypothetical protein
MQESHLFEYAVIRVVPRVEREEFLNVGVILYCRDQRFLQIKYTLDNDRLRALCDQTDLEELDTHLKAFEKISQGSTEGGPIGKLDIASRFRWLTAARSTVVQTSKVHPGLCTDAGEMLGKLHTQLVL